MSFLSITLPDPGRGGTSRSYCQIQRVAIPGSSSLCGPGGSRQGGGGRASGGQKNSWSMALTSNSTWSATARSVRVLSGLATKRPLVLRSFPWLAAAGRPWPTITPGPIFSSFPRFRRVAQSPQRGHGLWGCPLSRGGWSSIPQILAETGAGLALPPLDIDSYVGSGGWIMRAA